jgi:hypothetical protein
MLLSFLGSNTNREEKKALVTNSHCLFPNKNTKEENDNNYHHFIFLVKFLKNTFCHHILCHNLSLGLVRVHAKREARECGRVWEWTFALPSELPFWELESQWTFESLENDCKGQNPLDWEVPYTIESFWTVDFSSGLAWPIWTFET